MGGAAFLHRQIERLPCAYNINNRKIKWIDPFHPLPPLPLLALMASVFTHHTIDRQFTWEDPTCSFLVSIIVLKASLTDKTALINKNK